MSDVDDYLDALDHPLREAVARLRGAVLGADPGITEHIKWRSPSFCHGGVDRVTFRLRPRHLDLVLHRGAKVRADAASFVFDDPTGLLRWPGPDRAVLTLEGAEIDARTPVVVDLVRRWVRA
ncbi:DUF1801 domain-containing protein [Pseudonocardia broussonetiae]|uniref:DUF1801 domain-containing protein n=1 Tax=Pseudonocardia broussonetiae TaxID=2736640 RepID=UPI0019652649|nr:DUF1801 domain-containing protein [Pseudonocardia broussonetiae]